MHSTATDTGCLYYVVAAMHSTVTGVLYRVVAARHSTVTGRVCIVVSAKHCTEQEILDFERREESILGIE